MAQAGGALGARPRQVRVHAVDEWARVTRGVRVAACMLTEPHQIVDEQSVIRRLNALTLDGVRGGEQCSCCGAGPFDSREQQTAHYKHHWHAYNLKRKLFGKSPITLANFNNRQDDNSSVSGSDSDAEDGAPASDISSDLFAAATRHCKAFFTNAAGEVFCMYRCILHHRKEALSTDGEGYAWVERCRLLCRPGQLRWAVVMISGGHFAAAIFDGATSVLHKTLHSYVVRRGRGLAQGTRDAQGNAPKSGGASLRRYNQAQFALHVQEILAGWSAELAGCSLVLYRAVGPANQAILFGKASPLMKDDPRCRALPFPTRKPTYKEVQRAHDTVSNIEVYDTMEQFQKALIASSVPAVNKSSEADRSRKNKNTPPKLIDRAKSREPIVRELPSIVSSEDEGPCFIDSETPDNWIRVLSEQSSNGVITNSRKDLLNDPLEAQSSESEKEPGKKTDLSKKKKKAKTKEEPKVPVVRRVPVKISANVKKLWKVISDGDRSSLETIVEGWGEKEVDLMMACNTADPADGNTALHKAAIASEPDIVTKILNWGGDPCARNHALQTPYVATEHRDTRLAFRLFQGEHPDKFNYAKAHIPGALTPELLAAEVERKAQQRRAKRQRDKEKQVEKTRTNKFLDLTDVEKLKLSKEARCFLCGSQLGKKPFEYDKYKFCTVKCLQNHRNVRPLNLPA